MFTLTVPSAPRNFTLLQVPGSPTSLSASWMEPDPANGIISNYSISCNAPSLMSALFIFNGSVMSATLENLTPFMTYTCTISAVTGAGTGNDSEPQSAMTDEDGKCT